jgi:hypothetical protein
MLGNQTKPNDSSCSSCGQQLPDGESVHATLEYKSPAKTNRTNTIQTKGGGYKTEQELKMKF